MVAKIMVMSINSFYPKSLKAKVTVFTLVIFVVSIWALSLYVSHMLYQDMERQLGEQQFSAASYVSSEINTQLEDRIKGLEMTARTITPSMLSSPAVLQQFIDQRFVLHNQFNSGIFALVHDGTAIADSPSANGRIGFNFMDRDFAAGALKEGRSTVGSPSISKVNGAKVIAVAVPIYGQHGMVIGALVGSINLDKPNFLDKITENGYGKTGGYLLVAPKYRLVVMATDKSRITQQLPAAGVNPFIDSYVAGYEGHKVIMNQPGVEQLTSVKKIPVAGWYLAVALPTEEAFAPIRDMRLRMLLATIFLTLLAAGLIWWMLRRQLSPMLDTVKLLASLPHAKEYPHALPITSQDEIGALIGGFNRLLEMLEQREDAQEEVLSRLQKIASRVPGVVFQFRLRPDGSSCVPYASEVIREIYRVSPEEVREDANKIFAAVHPDDLSQHIESIDKSAKNLTLWHNEYRLKFEGESEDIWVLGSAVPQREADGSVLWHGIVSDITERKQAEIKLAESEARLRAIINNEPECIKILDAQGRLVQMNPAGLAMIEADAFEQVVGQQVINIIAPEYRTAFVEMHKRVISGEAEQMEFEVIGLKGGRRWLESHSVPMQDNGKTVLLAVTRDITERKEHEKQLEHIEHYDSLTNLPNRVLLSDRLYQGMSQVQRRKNLLAVTYIDLDGFKAVNDNYGHELGDQLLVILATRMKQALREGDTLARLGGDEFVAVLFDLEDVKASIPLLARLLEAAAQRVEIGDLSLQVSASLGVTIYPQAGDVEADQLLRQADQAMYQAKLAGKNRYHIFDAEQDSSIRGHNESLEHIRHALIEREFVLYYQPKVNMRTGKVIGAEALIRWQHPEKGLLAPAAFLPVIEDHSLAIDIGEWVIDAALTQMEIWHSAGLDIPVSVNVGARQLQQADFVANLRVALERHPEIKPGSLELEVLETSALEDVVRVSRIIKTCREIGVKFALDDFGTGYSSLTYLKRLPVSVLKIDQTFVRDMLDDPDDLAILEGVLSLATAFRRDVIAEGVETFEHGAMLLQLGCELAQGYGIARPMPAHEISDWVKNWHPDISWKNIPAISRDDLPILYASIEHRAWIAAIETFLKDESNAMPPLDHLNCRFGQWLTSYGFERHGTHPAYPFVETLHQQVHSLSAELVSLHGHGQGEEALAQMEKLYQLRDDLLKQLKRLMQ